MQQPLLRIVRSKFDFSSTNSVLQYSRVALFIIYFWFGFLKVLNLSPASPLVESLFNKTIAFLPFSTFMVGFGIFEMLIGVCFLFGKLNKLGLILIVPHLIATFLPLVLLPEVTWQKFMVPTIEGQYILKNLVIIAVSLFLYTSMARTAVKLKLVDKEKTEAA